MARKLLYDCMMVEMERLRLSPNLIYRMHTLLHTYSSLSRAARPDRANDGHEAAVSGGGGGRGRGWSRARAAARGRLIGGRHCTDGVLYILRRLFCLSDTGSFTGVFIKTPPAHLYTPPASSQAPYWCALFNVQAAPRHCNPPAQANESLGHRWNGWHTSCCAAMRPATNAPTWALSMSELGAKRVTMYTSFATVQLRGFDPGGP